jgi:hypothetical protein
MRLDQNLLDDQDQPLDSAPDSGLFTDIPKPIWIIFLSAWALVFGLFGLFFTTDGPATLAVVTAAFFALMILGLPAALARQSKCARREFNGLFDTRNGPLGVGAAATQIVLIPIAAVIGVIAFIALGM